MIALAIAFALLAPPQAELLLRYDAGHTYRITTTEKRSVKVGKDTQKENSTVVSDRVVTKGGVYGREPISWVETITKAPKEIIGASYRVGIGADAAITISDVKVPDPALEAFFSGEMLGGLLDRSMKPLRPKTVKKGDKWAVDLTGSIPFLEGRIEMTWTVAAITKEVIKLKSAIRHPQVTANGTAEITRDTGVLRLSDTTMSVKMALGGRKMAMKSSTRVTMERIATASPKKPSTPAK